MAWILVCTAHNWTELGVKSFLGAVPAGGRIMMKVDHYLPISLLGDLAGAEYWAQYTPQMGQFSPTIEDVWGEGFGTIVVVMKMGNRTPLSTFFQVTSLVVSPLYGFLVKEIRIYADQVVTDPGDGDGNGEDWLGKYWVWLAAGGILVFALLMRKR